MSPCQRTASARSPEQREREGLRAKEISYGATAESRTSQEITAVTLSLQLCSYTLPTPAQFRSSLQISLTKIVTGRLLSKARILLTVWET